MELNLNVIIVDDEYKAAKTLEYILQIHFPFIKIQGIAHDVTQAEQLIKTYQPDIVFLDIVMPVESGFELLKKFETIDFEIIFVTSHVEFALDAIKCCALGYILKPVDLDELRGAINIAKDRKNLKNKEKLYEALLINLDDKNIKDHQITLNDKTGIELIKVKEIIKCEGWNRYTKIHLLNGKIIISSYSIGRFISLLEKYTFIHVHKSYLVNKYFIVKILNTNEILMEDGSLVPLSFRKKSEVLQLLNNI